MRPRLAIFLASLWIAASTAILRAEESSDEGARADPAPALVTTARLRGHRRRVRTLSFHPGGKVLASGGVDRTLRLWDLERLEVLAVLTIPRSG